MQVFKKMLIIDSDPQKKKNVINGFMSPTVFNASAGHFVDCACFDENPSFNEPSLPPHVGPAARVVFSRTVQSTEVHVIVGSNFEESRRGLYEQERKAKLREGVSLCAKAHRKGMLRQASCAVEAVGA